MAYCTQADLQEQVSEAILIQLTDDANGGAVDSSVVARAIADADAEIDSYCAGRYSVPLSPVPAIILKLAVDIAIYNLYARRKGATEDRQKRYDNAVRLLKDIARGLVALGATTPAPANTENTVSIAANGRIFTRAKLGGY